MATRCPVLIILSHDPLLNAVTFHALDDSGTVTIAVTAAEAQQLSSPIAAFATRRTSGVGGIGSFG